MMQVTDALHLLRHYLNVALPEHARSDPDCQAEITDMLAYFEALDKRVAKLEASLQPTAIPGNASTDLRQTALAHLEAVNTALDFILAEPEAVRAVLKREGKQFDGEAQLWALFGLLGIEEG